MTESMRDNRKATKTTRAADLRVADAAVSKLKLEASPESRDRYTGLAALERLYRMEAPPSRSTLPMDAEPEQSVPPELPMSQMDEMPTNGYIVLTSLDESGRSRRPRVLKDEYYHARSSLPEVGDANKSVQVRSPDGKVTVGYGYFQRSDQSVYVVLWLPRAHPGKEKSVRRANAMEGKLSLGSRFWFDRFFKALEYRQTVLDLDNVNSFVLLNGDVDGCPGVQVSLYNVVAHILVKDTVAISYLAFLVDFLKTRTPVTSIYVSSPSHQITRSLPKWARGSIGQDFSRVYVTEMEISFLTNIMDPHLQFKPSKRYFRDVVRTYATGNVAVFGDTSGATLLSALRGESVEKCILVDPSSQVCKNAMHQVRYNFVSDETEFKREESRRGFVYHEPNLEQRVRTHESAIDSFLAKLSQDQYRTFVLDFTGRDANYSNPAWLQLVIRRAVRAMDVHPETGGFFFLLTLFDQRESMTIIREALATSPYIVRLVEAVDPTPDASKGIATDARPLFSGWVVNVRHP
eukprot:TRINITY_DN3713_c0_g2_i1.p1 TRINITY_DN3713_c0_g2~~TRINITY_DN3713_c0_g2_i1.p1  ORF type:complete len:555 (+),score=122.02 TRINITY_DN3713_c0_g2_i1:110-1666(+)